MKHQIFSQWNSSPSGSGGILFKALLQMVQLNSHGRHRRQASTAKVIWKRFRQGCCVPKHFWGVFTCCIFFIFFTFFVYPMSPIYPSVSGWWICIFFFHIKHQTSGWYSEATSVEHNFEQAWASRHFETPPASHAEILQATTGLETGHSLNGLLLRTKSELPKLKTLTWVCFPDTWNK